MEPFSFWKITRFRLKSEIGLLYSLEKLYNTLDVFKKEILIFYNTINVNVSKVVLLTFLAK